MTDWQDLLLQLLLSFVLIHKLVNYYAIVCKKWHIPLQHMNLFQDLFQLGRIHYQNSPYMLLKSHLSLYFWLYNVHIKVYIQYLIVYIVTSSILLKIYNNSLWLLRFYMPTSDNNSIRCIKMNVCRL